MRYFFGLLFLLACSNRPSQADCEPFAWKCEGDRPHICSPSAPTRWYPTGDGPCNRTPRQHCQVVGEIATCVRGTVYP